MTLALRGLDYPMGSESLQVERGAGIQEKTLFGIREYLQETSLEQSTRKKRKSWQKEEEEEEVNSQWSRMGGGAWTVTFEGEKEEVASG